MATNYPSGLDSLSNPAGSDALSTGHASQHANANDAIEAIETELGTDPSGASATVKARFEAIEADSWVTSARIADGTITGSDIASGTVTSTNIANDTIVNADINAAAAIDVSKLSGVVPSASVGNLLTADQANPEGTTGFPSVNATLTNVADGVIGTNSLKVTATGTVPQLDFGCAVYDGTATMPTVPGNPHTFSFYAKSPDITELVVQFLYGDGTNAAAAVTVTSAWQHFSVTKIAPTTGPFVVKVRLYAVTTATKYFQIDKLGFWQGAGGQWALPGTPITNLGFYTDESVGRRIFTWDTVNSRWQRTYGDTGWRLVALENSWAGSAYIRRENNRVTMQVFNLAGAATLTAVQYTIPAGFQGGGTTFFTARETAVSGAAVWGQTRTVAEFRKTLTGETYNAGTWSMTWESNWSTADAWPSSLPGSASGSIPQ